MLDVRLRVKGVGCRVYAVGVTYEMAKTMSAKDVVFIIFGICATTTPVDFAKTLDPAPSTPNLDIQPLTLNPQTPTINPLPSIINPETPIIDPPPSTLKFEP